MTWQGKRRKQLPSNWGSIRKRVLERDGYRCTVYDSRKAEVGGYTMSWRCLARATEVHHVNGPLDHSLSSLRSICAAHHAEETQREAKAAQAKVSRRRPVAKHPGLR